MRCSRREHEMVQLSPVTGDKGFCLSYERLETLAGSLGPSYEEAEPFPHAVIDGFFPDAVAARIIDEFPPLDQGQWQGSGVQNPQRRLKYMSHTEEAFSPFIRRTLYELNARPFLRFVESVTGIAPLLPDPDIGHTLRHFERGGCLGVHTDFNWHKGIGLHRRVNLIVYLNQDWRDEYGGHLELWDDAMTRCVKRIAPMANRALLFATDDHTPHGFPEPLACPPGKRARAYRCTIIPAALRARCGSRRTRRCSGHGPALGTRRLTVSTGFAHWPRISFHRSRIERSVKCTGQ